MRILVVDDEKNIRRTMAMALESMDHEVVCVATGAEAFKELKNAAFEVVFLDLKLHQESGLEVLGEILRLAPQIAVVIVTAFASIETAVEAMRRGAFDYLPKPCTPDRTNQTIGKPGGRTRVAAQPGVARSRFDDRFSRDASGGRHGVQSGQQ
jgi:NtrC-family two-component system response regulator AlgB